MGQQGYKLEQSGRVEDENCGKIWFWHKRSVGDSLMRHFVAWGVGKVEWGLRWLSFLPWRRTRYSSTHHESPSDQITMASQTICDKHPWELCHTTIHHDNLYQLRKRWSILNWLAILYLGWAIDVVGVRVCHTLEIELLHHAKWINVRSTSSIYHQGAHSAWTVHLEWKMFFLCSSLAPLRPVKALLKTSSSLSSLLYYFLLFFHKIKLTIFLFLLLLISLPFGQGDDSHIRTLRSNVS